MRIMEEMEFFIIPSNTPALNYSKFNNMKNPLISLKFLRVRSSEVQGFLKKRYQINKNLQVLEDTWRYVLLCYRISIISQG